MGKNAEGPGPVPTVVEVADEGCVADRDDGGGGGGGPIGPPNGPETPRSRGGPGFRGPPYPGGGPGGGRTCMSRSEAYTGLLSLSRSRSRSLKE